MARPLFGGCSGASRALFYPPLQGEGRRRRRRGGVAMPRSPTINEFKRNAARRLRQNATDAERRLWRALKRIVTRGTHFRRQMPIGNFIVDSACPAARLVIEIDGSQHAEVPGLAYDQERSEWLESQEYRVLRFWNNDVAQNTEEVLVAIYSALYGSRSALPRALKHRRHRRFGIRDTVTPP